MADWKPHLYRVGSHLSEFEKEPEDPETYRKDIEPWLSAVFQSEHFSLLLGTGFTIGAAVAVDAKVAPVAKTDFSCELADKVDEYAEQSAKRCGRGNPNIEDQIRAANQLLAGLRVMEDKRATDWKNALDKALTRFLHSILDSERWIQDAAASQNKEKTQEAETLLQSFLLSFASRAASRERLNLFTTNYDRLIEYGCDLAGLHIIDRFVGSLSPIFLHPA